MDRPAILRAAFSATPEETSGAARWQTPPCVYRPLAREFGFGLDAAAVANSARVPWYLGPDHPNPERRDAFTADWSAAGFRPGAAVWCNPPYGKEMGRWIELFEHWGRVVPVVALVFVRSDLPWWGDVVIPTCSEVRFVKGRIRFLHGDTGTVYEPGGTPTAAAPTPSVILVWRPGDRTGSPRISAMRQDRAYSGDRASSR